MIRHATSTGLFKGELRLDQEELLCLMLLWYLKKGKVNELEPSSSPEISLEEECREMTAHSTSLYSTINLLMRKLFSEEILNSSVSLKAVNSTSAAKPSVNHINTSPLSPL